MWARKMSVPFLSPPLLFLFLSSPASCAVFRRNDSSMYEILGDRVTKTTDFPSGKHQLKLCIFLKKKLVLEYGAEWIKKLDTEWKVKEYVKSGSKTYDYKREKLAIDQVRCFLYR